MLNRTTFRTHGIRTSLICIALAVLALMASGCALNPSAKDTGLPKTVVVAQGTDATSMDPARRVGFPSLNINMHISDPLVFGDPEKGIVPWLAESWSNPDDTTWVFNLRKGVKFHNGEPFNAEAAAYSLERFRDRDIPGLKHAYYWDIRTIVSAEPLMSTRWSSRPRTVCTGPSCSHSGGDDCAQVGPGGRAGRDQQEADRNGPIQGSWSGSGRPRHLGGQQGLLGASPSSTS